MTDLHRPLDDIILDQMYKTPDYFRHLDTHEYIKILIEDIRFWKSNVSPLLETIKNTEVFGTAYLEVRRIENGFEFVPLPPDKVTVSVHRSDGRE